MGGMVAGDRARLSAAGNRRCGLPISDWRSDRKEKVIVGVNDYLADEKPIEILRIDDSVGGRQEERLRRLRASRSNEEVERKLAALRKAAGDGDNLMPHWWKR